MLASLGLPDCALSQPQQYHCVSCGKPITSQAVVIEGKLFHPECFKCAACGKPISGDYLKDAAGKFYHPSCLQAKERVVCTYCGKSITDPNFTNFEGKTYHNECYKDFVAKRCDVCGDVLDGMTITDYWGNRFHARHAKEFPVCVVCGRLIARDGVEIEPNRKICSICAETAVKSPERARELLESVRDRMARIGIVIKTLGLRVQLVKVEELDDGKHLSATAHNYGSIQWNGGKPKSGDETALIRVLTGLPEDLTRGVIAHELMHIWQHENGVETASAEIREGSANWASSLIYSQLGNERGKFFIGGMTKSDDPIYGGGYRKVAKYADSEGIEATLQMLKDEAR